MPRHSVAQWDPISLLPRTEAEAHGLTRAWYTQVPLDPARSKVTYVTLQAGLLMVVTNDAMLHVIDAETGLLRWSFEASKRSSQTLAASANDKYVAVVSGTMLFVLDRGAGSLYFKREVTGVPDQGPTVTANHVAVPNTLGPIEVYPLNVEPEKILYPQYLECPGRIVGRPVVLGDALAWTTDQDKLRGHQFAELGVDFTDAVMGGVSTAAAVFPPYAFVGTRSGYVYAYDAVRSAPVWEFTSPSAIRRKPVALGTALYAMIEDGGMYSIDPKNGNQLWFSPDPKYFISASPDRIYTLDRYGSMAIIDAKTGAHTSSMKIPSSLKPLVNDQSDRLFFFTDDGLIQCLHELNRTTPISYTPPPPKAKEPLKKPAAKPAAEGAAPAEAPAGGAAAAAAASG